MDDIDKTQVADQWATLNIRLAIFSESVHMYGVTDCLTTLTFFKILYFEQCYAYLSLTFPITFTTYAWIGRQTNASPFYNIYIRGNNLLIGSVSVFGACAWVIQTLTCSRVERGPFLWSLFSGKSKQYKDGTTNSQASCAFFVVKWTLYKATKT